MGRALKELTDHRNDRVYTLARTYTHARTDAVFCSRFFFLRETIKESPRLTFSFGAHLKKYPLGDSWVKNALFILFSIIDLHYRINYLSVSVSLSLSLYQNQ